MSHNGYIYCFWSMSKITDSIGGEISADGSLVLLDTCVSEDVDTGAIRPANIPDTFINSRGGEEFLMPNWPHGSYEETQIVVNSAWYKGE